MSNSDITHGWAFHQLSQDLDNLTLLPVEASSKESRIPKKIRPTLSPTKIKCFCSFYTDHKYLQRNQPAQPPIPPPPKHTCAQQPQRYWENVWAFSKRQPGGAVSGDVQREYNEGLRLPTSQAWSSTSTSLFSWVEGKCGQVGRVTTTACCAERCVKSRTFAGRKEGTNYPEQSRARHCHATDPSLDEWERPAGTHRHSFRSGVLPCPFDLLKVQHIILIVQTTVQDSVWYRLELVLAIPNCVRVLTTWWA